MTAMLLSFLLATAPMPSAGDAQALCADPPHAGQWVCPDPAARQECEVNPEPSDFVIDAGQLALINFDTTPRDGMMRELVRSIFRTMLAASCYPKGGQRLSPNGGGAE